MPIFRVKSVKITLAKKNLHEYTRGVRDKYEVCIKLPVLSEFIENKFRENCACVQ